MGSPSCEGRSTSTCASALAAADEPFVLAVVTEPPQVARILEVLRRQRAPPAVA